MAPIDLDITTFPIYNPSNHVWLWMFFLKGTRNKGLKICRILRTMIHMYDVQFVHVYKVALSIKFFFLSSMPLTLRNMFLKILSSQIGSAWEWCHWIGLEKDINRYRFLIFKFQFWIFETTSKFWASSYKNESNLLLVRITVCKESFLPIGWHTFIWWKNPPKNVNVSASD
jgi:hypothetical protein